MNQSLTSCTYDDLTQFTVYQLNVSNLHLCPPLFCLVSGMPVLKIIEKRFQNSYKVCKSSVGNVILLGLPVLVGTLAYPADLQDPVTPLRTVSPKMKPPFVAKYHEMRPLSKEIRHWHLKI